MPCGYRDPRRQGHRCCQCRVHHNKCDSSRPCGPCKRGKMKCEEPLSSPPDVMIVAYHPRQFYQPLGRILSCDSWLYVRIFFDAIRCSQSPLLSAFSFEEIGPVVQEHGPIFDAVTTVGATYAKQTCFGLHLSPIQNSNIRQLCSTFRRQIAARIRDPDALQKPSFLLSVKLLAFLELMTDKTGIRWDQLIRKLQQRVFTQDHPSIGVEHFNSSLFKFIRLSFAFRSLMFHDDISLDKVCVDGSKDYSLPFGPQQQFPASSTEKIESLTHMLERWAQLRNRSLNWTRSTANARVTMTSSKKDFPQQAFEGLQIVDLACQVQQEIITMILLSTSRSGDSIVPFYHWILIGLCRLFSNSAWLSLGCKLPVMQKTMMNEQALMALSYAETSIETVQMEAIVYVPMVTIVGSEMSSAEDRGRVIRLVRNIENKGFAVVSAVESDVRLSWSHV